MSWPYMPAVPSTVESSGRRFTPGQGYSLPQQAGSRRARPAAATAAAPSAPPPPAIPSSTPSSTPSSEPSTAAPITPPATTSTTAGAMMGLAGAMGEGGTGMRHGSFVPLRQGIGQRSPAPMEALLRGKMY